MKKINIILLFILFIGNTYAEITGPAIICRSETATFSAEGYSFVYDYTWYIFEGNDYIAYVINGEIHNNDSRLSITSGTLESFTFKNINLEGDFKVKRTVRYCYRRVLGMCADERHVDQDYEIKIHSGMTDRTVTYDETSPKCASVNTTLNYTTDLQSNRTVFTVIPSGAASLSFPETGRVIINWNDYYEGDAYITSRADYYYSSTKTCYGETKNHATVEIEKIGGTPSIPIGNSSACQGSENNIYNVTQVDGAHSYQWIITPTEAGVIDNNGSSCSIDFNSSFVGIATLKVRAMECDWGNWSTTKTITVTQIPDKASTPSGLSEVCQGQISVSYTTTATRATSYSYRLNPTTAGSLSITGNTAIINFDEDFSGNVTLYAKGVNCDEGEESDGKAIIVKPLPVEPSDITGLTEVCQGNAGLVYTIPIIVNATSYEWYINPETAATITNNGRSCSIDLNDDYKENLSIKVRGLNCGIGSWSNELDVDIIPLVTKPNKPSGEYELCQDNQNTTYTTNNVENADNYEWILTPTEAGTITLNNNSCEVNWSSYYNGSASLKVRAYNTCGYSEWSDPLNINLSSLPSKCEPPSGLTSLCQGTENSDYTTNPCQNAISYEWSIIPADCGTVSSIGTQSTVIWNSDYSGNALLKVRGINDCGAGTWSDNIQIKINPLPTKPSTPLGSTSVCENSQNINYSINLIPSAVNYEWSVTPSYAATIYNNGTSAVLDFNNNNEEKVYLKVRGVSCNAGEWSDEVEIEIIPLAEKLNMPNGETSLCQDSENEIYTTNSVINTNIEWDIVPETAGILSNTNSEVEINWSSSFKGLATLKVRSYNTCNTSEWSDGLQINISPLPSASSIPYGQSGCSASEIKLTVDTINYAEEYIWSVSPIDEYTIKGTNNTNSIIIIPNLDYSGQISFKTKGVNVCGEGNWSQSSYINIIASPKEPIIKGDTLICSGENLVLETTNNTGVTTSWFDENENLLLINNKIDYLFNKEGENEIYVQYNNTSGCNSPKKKINFFIAPLPSSEFTFSSNEITPGEIIQFAATSVNDLDSLFYWNFGDSYSAEGSNVMHVFDEIGTYNVSLIVKNIYGCSDTTYKNIGQKTSLESIKMLGINVYPNPAKDYIIIDNSNYDKHNDIKVSIIDLSGRLQYNKSIYSKEEIIDISELETGFYSIIIEVNSIQSINKLIIE